MYKVIVIIVYCFHYEKTTIGSKLTLKYIGINKTAALETRCYAVRSLSRGLIANVKFSSSNEHRVMLQVSGNSKQNLLPRTQHEKLIPSLLHPITCVIIIVLSPQFPNLHCHNLTCTYDFC